MAVDTDRCMLLNTGVLVMVLVVVTVLVGTGGTSCCCSTWMGAVVMAVAAEVATFAGCSCCCCCMEAEPVLPETLPGPLDCGACRLTPCCCWLVSRAAGGAVTFRPCCIAAGFADKPTSEKPAALLVPAPNICAVGSLVHPCRPIVTLGSSLLDDMLVWVRTRAAGVSAASRHAWMCNCLDPPAATAVSYRDLQKQYCIVWIIQVREIDRSELPGRCDAHEMSESLQGARMQ